MSRATADVQAHWSAIRRGGKAKTNTVGGRVDAPAASAPSARQLNGSGAQTALAAHRAKLEHDYFRGNPVRVRLLREAAAAFDDLMARQKAEARKKGGRPRKVPEVVIDE